MSARIVTTHGKIVYGVFGLIGTTLLAVPAALLAGGAGTAVAALLVLALIGVGARLFRGAGEPVEPPRAWWRFTAAPTAGFAIAGVFAIQALATVVSAWFAGIAGSRDAPEPSGTGAAAGVVAAVIAVAYLHSSLRLRAGQR
jgi:hypothetical protein